MFQRFGQILRAKPSAQGSIRITGGIRRGRVSRRSTIESAVAGFVIAPNFVASNSVFRSTGTPLASLNLRFDPEKAGAVPRLAEVSEGRREGCFFVS